MVLPCAFTGFRVWSLFSADRDHLQPGSSYRFTGGDLGRVTVTLAMCPGHSQDQDLGCELLRGRVRVEAWVGSSSGEWASVHCTRAAYFLFHHAMSLDS